MPKTKKKFIDKKKSVTFNLVHRSQRDPLIADERAPQRVLVPVNVAVPSSAKKEAETQLTLEQRLEQQRKYGIYFDDDYNYLQHLKDTKEVTLLLAPKAEHKRKSKSEQAQQDANEERYVAGRMKLPSSVFASEVEEDVGLLNKAAPQGLNLQLDPEVVAALDEDFDFDDPDNELEDNFIELAMGDDASDIDSNMGDYGEEEFDENDENDLSDDEDGDISDEGDNGDDDRSDRAFASDNELNISDDEFDCDNTNQKNFRLDKDDTMSRFSQYSMSSSVIKRNKGLTLLDDRFEKMFAQYDDTEMGPLDCDEIEGFLPESDDMVLQAAEEFEQSKKKYMLDKEKEIARIQRLQEIEEETETSNDELVSMPVKEKPKWDCESILSTYSNIYNHPKLIQEPKKQSDKIKIHSRSGIPVDTLGKDGKLTMKSLAKFNALYEEKEREDDGLTHAESVLSTLSVLSIRPKDESAEDKKERKRLLKEFRKERRIEKKANKEVFKEEKKRQEKIMMNNRNNVQGNRIL